MQKHPDPDKLDHTAKKLQWYRHFNNLFQREVAVIIGIDRSTYIRYESTSHNLYPQDKLIMLAKLFRTNITSLLDDYNLFLYNGQGKQIKALRNRLGLTIPEFAKLHNKNPKTIRKWKKDEVIIFKSTWKKLFYSKI